MDDGIVIVGASHAGIGFAEAMRGFGYTGSLILIEKQGGLPVERPPLSKEFLLMEKEEVNDRFFLRTADWFLQKNVELKTGITVASVNRAKISILLSNGSNINYQKLVFATGAIPYELPNTQNLKNVNIGSHGQTLHTFGRKLKNNL